jgi:hypothetical protein
MKDVFDVFLVAPCSDGGNCIGLLLVKTLIDSVYQVSAVVRASPEHKQFCVLLVERVDMFHFTVAVVFIFHFRAVIEVVEGTFAVVIDKEDFFAYIALFLVEHYIVVLVGRFITIVSFA